MAVVVVAGEKFAGVDYGTALGIGTGYIVGTEPVCKLLQVDEADHAAWLIGVKYYHHRADDQDGSNRPPNEFVRLTMLVNQGRWRQKVWCTETGQFIAVVLQEPGDFIAWVPGLWHSWYPEVASTMLTVNFKRRSA